MILILWIVVTVGLRLAAPSWDDIAQDGDFAYLPEETTTLRGQRILSNAFPEDRAKSQVAMVVARPDRELSESDQFVAVDVSRRFLNILGASLLQHARLLKNKPDADAQSNRRAEELLELGEAALRQAIELDDQLVEFRRQQSLDLLEAGKTLPPPTLPLAETHHNLAQINTLLGRPEEAEQNQREAWRIDPALAELKDRPAPLNAAEWPMIDVWTWRDPVIGPRLMSHDGRAVLVVAHLTTEFTATENIELVERIGDVLHEVQINADAYTEPGLEIEYSGSAAVGGDMFRGFRDSLQHTEVLTVVLVFLILSVVYRSPLLVAVPLLTIAVSWFASTALVALLSQVGTLPGMGWWELQVFTTTRIFIVVILFGAGTDFCLFLISRYREELGIQPTARKSVAASLTGVGEALSASALTTILGLGMMFFAEFGKFRYSGPIIGICLFVTLLACLTFAPALLCAFGKNVFWPIGLPKKRDDVEGDSGWMERIWERVAILITKRPALLLAVSILVMAPFACWGLITGGTVTYDFAATLSPKQPSRVGAAVLRRHFDVGEMGPVGLLIEHPEAPFDTPAGEQAIADLAEKLRLPGVLAVRSVVDPLGEGEVAFSAAQWEKMAVRASKRVRGIFVSQSPPFKGRVARIEVVIDADPFSDQARDAYHLLAERVDQAAADPDSLLHGAEIAWTGVTPAIDDLRNITRADTFRIEILVVVVVFLVLLVIIRRPVVCVYLILSVLFSFLVTIGFTELLFMWLYGDTWQGLDWKLPVFLFVILVAVGQDYNVYLVTRVFEEQKRLGPVAGLRRAVVCTGGIITSCGIIMAGTFLSMTGGVWLTFIPEWVPIIGPYAQHLVVLRGIVELGFALSLGVLLDTFVVRPILVPAFIALWDRVRFRSLR